MSDNISDKISNSILGSNDVSSIPSLSSDIGASSSSDSGMSSFFDWIKEISLTTWLLVILILAFLGFNIFVYLAKGTQEFNSFFAPIIQKVFSIFGAVTGQVVDISAEGAKAVVNTSANVVTTGLTGVQNITPSKQVQPKTSQTTTKGQEIKTTFPQGDVAQANTVNKAINSSTAQKQQVNGEDYQADESTSSIQNGASKAGWCYIGEDRGFRSCAEVGVNDTCMSGDIFPTSQVCVNPSLRA
jgi:DNA-directed RNA polymerase subunit E'/Rpb7